MAPKIVPVWVQTIGAMREHGTRLRMTCRSCERVFRVPLDLLVAARGPSYSLLNRFPRCPIWNCDGRCIILYSPGGGTPFRPLSSWPLDQPR